MKVYQNRIVEVGEAPKRVCEERGGRSTLIIQNRGAFDVFLSFGRPGSNIDGLSLAPGEKFLPPAPVPDCVIYAVTAPDSGEISRVFVLEA